MSTLLSTRECIPCRGGVPKLTGEAISSLSGQLHAEWKVVAEHHIERTYRFANFREALDFTIAVGEMAETQGHHPDIELAWGKAKLILWTHKIDGLTESDFIFAAKADLLYKP